MFVTPNFTALNSSTGDKGTRQTRSANPVSPPEKQHVVGSSHPDETQDSGTYSCTATCSVWLTLIVIFISVQNVWKVAVNTKLHADGFARRWICCRQCNSWLHCICVGVKWTEAQKDYVLSVVNYFRLLMMLPVLVHGCCYDGPYI